MREGLQDKIVNRIVKLQSRAAAKIKSETHGQKPFASVRVHPEDLIYAKNTLGYDDLGTLIMEFGAPAVNKFLYEVAMLENRRGIHAQNQTLPSQSAPASTLATPSPQIAQPTQTPQAPLGQVRRF